MITVRKELYKQEQRKEIFPFPTPSGTFFAPITFTRYWGKPHIDRNH